MTFKNLLLLITIIYCNCVISQNISDTTYYNTNNQAVDSIVKNGYSRVISYSSDNSFLFNVKEYYSSGSLKMSGKFRSINPDKKEGEFLYYYANGNLKKKCTYKNNELTSEYLSYYISGSKKTKSFYKDSSLDGISKTWYENGTLKKEIHYDRGIKDGAFKTYYDSGELLRSEVYKDGERIREQCYTKTGKDTSYFEHIAPPTFLGGTLSNFISWIQEKIDGIYNESNVKDKTNLSLSFVITKTGEIDKIVVHNVSSSVVSSAINSLLKKSPVWKPGRKDLEAVDTKVRIPIIFK